MTEKQRAALAVGRANRKINDGLTGSERWRKKHPDKALAASRKSRAKNIEKIRARDRAFKIESRKREPEKFRAYRLAYAAKHKEHRRERDRVRYAKNPQNFRDDKNINCSPRRAALSRLQKPMKEPVASSAKGSVVQILAMRFLYKIGYSIKSIADLFGFRNATSAIKGESYQLVQGQLSDRIASSYIAKRSNQQPNFWRAFCLMEIRCSIEQIKPTIRKKLTYEQNQRRLEWFHTTCADIH